VIPVPSHDPFAAYHESSHAVVALALGHQVTHLSLDHCRTRYRVGDEMASWNEAVIAISGPMAELRFIGYPEDVQDLLWRSAWTLDRRRAGDWLRQLSGVSFGNTEVCASHLVNYHWEAVVRIAEILIARGELSGLEVERLWRDFAP
jgi:hypothetical protein